MAMKRWRKWLFAAAAAYVVVCLVLGWGTTALFNHYVLYAYHFDNNPARSKSWGLFVSDRVVSFSTDPGAQVNLGNGWIESGHLRRLTIPYVPSLDWFFMNRHSLKLEKPEWFRIVHFVVQGVGAEAAGVELADVPRGRSENCFGMESGFHCHVVMPDPPMTKIRGRVIDAEKRDAVGGGFVVSIAWP